MCTYGIQTYGIISVAFAHDLHQLTGVSVTPCAVVRRQIDLYRETFRGFCFFSQHDIAVGIDSGLISIVVRDKIVACHGIAGDCHRHSYAYRRGNTDHGAVGQSGIGYLKRGRN